MNSKISAIIKVVLLIAIVAMSYWLYSIIQEPITFEKIKEKRYTAVQNRLEQIRDAQKVYRAEYGIFADDFDKLIAFVDTGKKSLIVRKDSSFMYMDKVFQQEMEKDTIITRVIGYEPVKESLFGDDFNPEDLRFIPHTDKKEIEMSASKVKVNDVTLPVFEARASNSKIFHDVIDKYDQFIDEEYALTVGSLQEPTLSGNWR